MFNILSKTDYILYRECPKNAWMKIHMPDVYYASPLSEFEKHIIETGNKVELIARQLFPTGILIEGRDEAAQQKTADLILSKQPTLFQPLFVKDGILAALDILKYDTSSKSYSIYEVKASSEVDKKVHLYDLAFQVVLLRKCGLNVAGMNIIHLNKEFVRSGDLDIVNLFAIDDVREEIENIAEEVEQDMNAAKEYLLQEKEPNGPCCCIYKGRSSHCTTSKHSNPMVPAYSIHDLSRIGTSKKKLIELVDANIFNLEDLEDPVELNEAQQNQVNAYVSDQVLIKRGKIAEELEKLEYPLYFLDYETFPSATPLFDGYSPYDQVPFQYSLQIVDHADSEPREVNFLHVEAGKPSQKLANMLKTHIGPTGSVIVWYKPFEKSRNTEMGIRMPEHKEFFESINSRIYDLMEIFSKQLYVHKDFRGSSSIKKVLPVLVPELSYKDLNIQEGGTASQTWKKLIDGEYSEADKEKSIDSLKKYCERDTYAMYAIWKVPQEL